MDQLKNFNSLLAIFLEQRFPGIGYLFRSIKSNDMDFMLKSLGSTKTYIPTLEEVYESLHDFKIINNYFTYIHTEVHEAPSPRKYLKGIGMTGIRLNEIITTINEMEKLAKKGGLLD